MKWEWPFSIEDIVGAVNIGSEGRSVSMNKFAEPLPYADPKAAPRKVLEIAYGLQRPG
jgi:hypothetical protein